MLVLGKRVRKEVINPLSILPTLIVVVDNSPVLFVVQIFGMMTMINCPEIVTRYLEPAMLWFCLVIPSVFSVQKYFGCFGVSVYLVAAACAVWALSRLQWQLNEREAFWCSLGTFVILAVLFAIGYPIANTHIPGMGSDDDDALNIAVVELINGRNPYYVRTYLGNLIHHFPGAFVLAAPFVLLGTSAFQNLLWLALFFLVLRRELDNTFAALRWFWLTLIFSPVVIHQLITGTGHVANAIYVMLGLWWLLHSQHKVLPAATWGVMLSSRANFLLLIPLAFGWLAQRHGWKASVRLLAITCTICATLTLPFYFYDPQGFAPLEAADRLMQFNEVLPYAGSAAGIGMALLKLPVGLAPHEDLIRAMAKLRVLTGVSCDAWLSTWG